MTRDTLGLGRAYVFVWICLLATGILSNSHWKICTRWFRFFYRKSMVCPPRPHFCCLQHHIILYVRSCCTTACCRRVVLLLHKTPYEMLRLLHAARLPVSIRGSRYNCRSCTTATPLLLLSFSSSVLSCIKKNILDRRKNHCCGK